jgi:Uma2 family endonuclease
MNVQSMPSLTVDQFFGWYEKQERRYELVGGKPRMQPYVKRNHARIASNIIHALMQVLDSELYQVTATDFAIRTGPATVRFPDIIVEKGGGAGDDREARHALIVMEILSESTQHIDFGEKRHEYLALDGLKSYIVLAQDKPYVWQWSRDEEGKWPDDPERLEGPTSVLMFAPLDVTVPLSTIYAGVR